MTTLRQEKENQGTEMEEVQRRLVYVSPKVKAKALTEEEIDGESGGSSEEMESPTSVGRWRRTRPVLHSQILRIREEDSHLGETSQKVAASGIDVVLFARPCSPLKHTVNAFR